MATTRLLTVKQTEHIISVLRHGYKENLKSCVIKKKYKLGLIDGIERIIRKSDGKIIVSSAEAPDVIKTVHEDLIHADDKETWLKLRETYGNISRLAVQEYLKKCQKCTTEIYGIYKALFKTIKPDLENRGHVDVIGMPSDGTYQFILHYRLVKTGFCILRPIKINTYEEIAFELYCIFVDFGYPDVLQSNSRKFTSHMIKELNKLSPRNLIISGKYKEGHQKYSQAIKEHVWRWMDANLSEKWSRGLPLVQWEENNAVKQNSSTPFESLFGRRSSLTISSVGVPNLLPSVLHEEEVQPLLELCNFNYLTGSDLPEHSSTVSSDAKAKISKNNKSIKIPNEKSTIQTVEYFKRKAQFSVADNAKKLKIIASFSLASGDVTVQNEVFSTAVSNSDTQKVTSVNHNLKATDVPAWGISVETSVTKNNHNISNFHIKTEPVDEEDPLQTRVKTDVSAMKFPTKAESSRSTELPLLTKIKEELIVPGM